MQQGKFKLKGLSREKSMTCEPLHNENIFWPNVGLSQEKFDELWNYVDSDWDDRKIAIIEHEGLYEDGTPINGTVIGIELM